MINTAGPLVPEGSLDNRLMGANSLLPFVVGEAHLQSGGSQFLHVTSAAVQGGGCLDETERMSPLSPYAVSNALGEKSFHLLPKSRLQVARYRSTTAQRPTRLKPLRLSALARSHYTIAASPETDPSPQVHVNNVVETITFLATLRMSSPAVALHPWEGLATTSILKCLGGKAPRTAPRALARTAWSILKAYARTKPEQIGPASCSEMLLFGQRQSHVWLSSAGWSPVTSIADWTDLAQNCASRQLAN